MQTAAATKHTLKIFHDVMRAGRSHFSQGILLRAVIIKVKFPGKEFEINKKRKRCGNEIYLYYNIKISVFRDPKTVAASDGGRIPVYFPDGYISVESHDLSNEPVHTFL